MLLIGTGEERLMEEVVILLVFKWNWSLMQLSYLFISRIILPALTKIARDYAIWANSRLN